MEFCISLKCRFPTRFFYQLCFEAKVALNTNTSSNVPRNCLRNWPFFFLGFSGVALWVILYYCNVILMFYFFRDLSAGLSQIFQDQVSKISKLKGKSGIRRSGRACDAAVLGGLLCGWALCWHSGSPKLRGDSQSAFFVAPRLPNAQLC